MDNNPFLKLDNGWSRSKVLDRLKKGENPESLLKNFINDNKNELEEVKKFISKENIHTLDHFEDLTYCENKLIKYIKSESTLNQKDSFHMGKKISSLSKIKFLFIKWSNKFVISILLLLSLFSLIKQA